VVFSDVAAVTVASVVAVLAAAAEGVEIEPPLRPAHAANPEGIVVKVVVPKSCVSGSGCGTGFVCDQADARRATVAAAVSANRLTPAQRGVILHCPPNIGGHITAGGQCGN
jgi:hypothetical protein